MYWCSVSLLNCHCNLQKWKVRSSAFTTCWTYKAYNLFSLIGQLCLTILQSNSRITTVWAISVSCYSCNTAVVYRKGVKTSHEDTLERCWCSLPQVKSHVVIWWTVDAVILDGTISQILPWWVPGEYHCPWTSSIKGNVLRHSCV